MTDPFSHSYTANDQQACALAYLTYLKEDEKSHPHYNVAVDIYKAIEANIPNVKVLSNYGKADWKIVWGPSLQFVTAQKNMMMVVQQISDPTNYMVVIRGTNFNSASSWFDDIDVGKVAEWVGPHGNTDENKYGFVSKGTGKILEQLLILKPLTPKGSGENRLPGTGATLEEYLKSIAKNKVKIRFCGHSLGGAMAPTLALYFAQTKGLTNSWDSMHNAQITISTFAGPSPGDRVFSTYLSSVIPDSSFNRVYDTNDVVPLAWNSQTFATANNIYADYPIPKMNIIELAVFNHLLKITKDKEYTQPGTGISFDFPVNTEGDRSKSFLKQMVYQHDQSYPNFMGVPEIIDIVYGNR